MGFDGRVALTGGYDELILPALILFGLFTPVAALGMAVFMLLQRLTDIVGHGIVASGGFNRASDGVILDQRAFWMLLVAVLFSKGAGPLSADGYLGVERPRLVA